MSDVLVIGGGFAGVWSAAAAARAREQAGADLTVTLVAPGDDLVLRPRLYEATPHRMRIPLERILSPAGVRRVPGTATAIDATSRTVRVVDTHGADRTLDYDRLVLATGSRLRRPDIPGAGQLFDADTLTSAVALDSHLNGLSPGPGAFTAVVVGAGFTGIEVATELMGRLEALAAPHGQQARVVLVDRASVIGPELGPGPRPVITSALDQLGVETWLSRDVASVAADAVQFADGTRLATRTVVWTAGVEAGPLTGDIPGRREHTGRLHVAEDLHVPEAPEVFVAGDAAAAVSVTGEPALPCCQHAMPLGKFAGYNAAADLLGLPTEPFAPDPYVTCLDLGAAGAVFTTGYDRAVQLTGDAAKARKRQVNEEWIYPPVDDAEALLRAADFRRSHRDTVRA